MVAGTRSLGAIYHLFTVPDFGWLVGQVAVSGDVLADVCILLGPATTLLMPCDQLISDAITQISSWVLVSVLIATKMNYKLNEPTGFFVV